MSEFFDRLAKTAAGGTSRRDALKYLGGLLAGGFLAGLPGKARADDGGGDDDEGNEEINERCQSYCKSCLGVKGGAHGYCIDHCKKALRQNPNATLCGKCSAKTRLTVCTGVASCCGATTNAPYCTNEQTDVKNCGACGKVCAGTTPACCSGKCADLATDANNCGKCGTKCTSTQKCTAGVCK